MIQSKACQSRTRIASKSNQLDERMSALARSRSIQLSRYRTFKTLAHRAASMAVAARSLSLKCFGGSGTELGVAFGSSRLHNIQPFPAPMACQVTFAQPILPNVRRLPDYRLTNLQFVVV